MLFDAQVELVKSNPAYSTKAFDFLLKQSGLDVPQATDDAQGLKRPISSDTHIPLLEQHGLMSELTLYIIRKVADDLAAWRDALTPATR